MRENVSLFLLFFSLAIFFIAILINKKLKDVFVSIVGLIFGGALVDNYFTSGSVGRLVFGILAILFSILSFFSEADTKKGISKFVAFLTMSKEEKRIRKQARIDKNIQAKKYKEPTGFTNYKKPTKFK
jgi:hypothetical protein